ncbi:MAG: beta-N-acetylhexosaminidase, partial [Sphingorhabdus sp.]
MERPKNAIRIALALLVAACTPSIAHVEPSDNKAAMIGTTGDRLLPLPKDFSTSGTTISIPKRIASVSTSNLQDERRAATVVAAMLARSGFTVRKATDRSAFALRFQRTAGLPPEGYRLTISAKGALVEASDHSGLFYGGISFWQLATAGGASLPVGVVTDHPQYRWRGLMLDSARHFQSTQFIRQFIDWMAAHKLNRFHWHLVDDQGWRVEIRKYPKLVETGAWRTPASVAGAPELPVTGGYYTQAEIRGIVAYAAERGIEIVPEIEMPGHALSAIRAYPEMGMGVPAPKGVESHWGVFPWLYNTEDRTFGFLTDILDEVMALFPSRYIHVGGDEAVKDQWKASPETQARIKALGLKDEHELQSWFMSRIGKHLEKNGRILIGWDEILEGGIPANATITSWRGTAGGVTAAKSGHDAVMSPAPDLYFDHIQSGSPHEPPGRGGVISLSAVLAYDPIPKELTEEQRRHILGLQGNIWTEHIRTEDRVAWMAFPRGAAIAEIGWNGASKEAALAFTPRLSRQLDRLKPFGLRAADSAFRPEIILSSAASRIKVALKNEVGAPM